MHLFPIVNYSKEVGIRSKMGYRKDIDGLRGISIVAVLAYHVFPTFFPGGSLGVDIFFVISGFLISSLILNELKAENFTLSKFYLRRTLRLVPSLALMLIVTSIMLYLYLTPGTLKEYSQSLISAVTFTSNLYLFRETDYFGAIQAQNFPLLHLWSLAVEEQFYLFFPLLLIFSVRKKVNLKILLVFIGLLSLTGYIGLNLVGMERHSFYLTPFRFWEFLLGAAAYFYRSESLKFSKRFYGQINVIGLVLIFLAIVLFGKTDTNIFIYNLIVAIGAHMLIVSGTQKNLSKILNNNFLIIVGKSSYSIYLWHLPLLYLSQKIILRPLNSFELIGFAIACVALGILITFFLEIPLLEITNFKKVLIYGVLPSMILLILGSTIFLKNGLEVSYYNSRLSIEQKNVYLLVSQGLREVESRTILLDESECKYDVSNLDNLSGKFINRHKKCLEKYGKPILLIGDSHSFNLFNLLSNSNIYLLGILKGGCRLSDQSSLQISKNCSYKEIFKTLSLEADQFDKVIYHQSGSHLILDKYGRGDSNMAFKSGLYTIDQLGIERTLESLSRLPIELDILWVGPFVEPRLDLFDSRNYFINRLVVDKATFQPFKYLDQEIEKITTTLVNQNTDLQRISYSSIISAMGLKANSSILIGDCLIYRDTDHLSKCGEIMLRSKLNLWIKENISR
jgi:peptidoglycan/LPS O-acetylase OafA/YrhL